MANRTVSDARNIHGTNPQYLLEKIIRSRIYESLYWKEDCFGLTAESLIDKADQLTCIGGQYGNQKPTEFLCLTLKLLQLQPEKEIIIDFIRNEDSKYLRALGAFYFRLIGDSVEIYKYLEPLLYDFRKLRRRLPDGAYDIIHMDEFIDSLLRDERVCDTIMPRILKRQVLEENEELEPRVSFLEDELEQEALAAKKKEEENKSRSRSRSSSRSSSRSRSRSNSRSRSRSNSRHRSSRKKSRSRSRSRSRRRSSSSSRSRSRSRSRDRGRRNHNKSYSRSRSRSYSTSRSRSRGRHNRHRSSRKRSYSSSYSRSRSRSRDRHRHSRSRSHKHHDRSRSHENSKDKNNKISSDNSSNKKKWNKKKVNSLFKGGSSSKNEKSSDSDNGGDGVKESMSIEETNKLRISLGLKPLK